jgi:hypothetical protein
MREEIFDRDNSVAQEDRSLKESRSHGTVRLRGSWRDALGKEYLSDEIEFDIDVWLRVRE